jgi:hypothetical protein
MVLIFAGGSVFQEFWIMVFLSIILYRRLSFPYRLSPGISFFSTHGYYYIRTYGKTYHNLRVWFSFSRLWIMVYLSIIIYRRASGSILVYFLMYTWILLYSYLRKHLPRSTLVVILMEYLFSGRKDMHNQSTADSFASFIILMLICSDCCARIVSLFL